ncbi:hypothetical protein L2E82_05975 [Cichorium intybus]|uniref:Uncharacterized protein n=1 Tax=Cichorium intybus TaxID=13427 RepID=A0ACB9H8N8_CICIN|nr:hypothetical protein L2E82_05975 [Cichorium intybus]
MSLSCFLSYVFLPTSVYSLLYPFTLSISYKNLLFLFIRSLFSPLNLSWWAQGKPCCHTSAVIKISPAKRHLNHYPITVLRLL